ncbi:MAG: hypothetical protein Kow0059_12890 [Candidatus Sumerlaeia bacterium]
MSFHSRFAPIARTFLLIPLVFMLGAPAALALKTAEVEFGRDGNYDGAAWIRREADGRLLFLDASITTPVALAALAQHIPSHGALTGLAADDHPQYLTASRHSAAHSAAANADLPVPADAGNNTTLGAHIQDTRIHPNRTALETITGLWRFTVRPELQGGARIGTAGDSGRTSVLFASDSLDAELRWQDLPREFQFSDPIAAPQARLPVLQTGALSLSGTLDGQANGLPAAELRNFASIEGIPPDRLLDSAADEDITGQWNFLNRLNLIHSDYTTQGSAGALHASLFAQVDSPTTLSQRRRTTLDALATLRNAGTGTLSDATAAAVRAETSVERAYQTNDGVGAFGLFAQASAPAPACRPVGVAGVAVPDANPASNAIAVFGTHNPGVWSNPDEIPTGRWAGYFEGDVAVTGALLLNGAPLGAPPANVLTVSPGGRAAFTTIQSAIDSISGASQTNPFIVLVYPGRYNETVTLTKGWVFVVGAGARESSVVVRDFPQPGAATFGDGTLNIQPGAGNSGGLANLTIQNTGTGAAAIAVFTGIGRVSLVNCDIQSGGRDTLTAAATDLLARDCSIVSSAGSNHAVWIQASVSASQFERCRIAAAGTPVQLFGDGAHSFLNCWIDGQIEVLDSPVIRLAGSWGEGARIGGTGAPTIIPLDYLSTLKARRFTLLGDLDAGGVDAGPIRFHWLSSYETAPPVSEDTFTIQLDSVDAGGNTGTLLKLEQNNEGAGGAEAIVYTYNAEQKFSLDKDGNALTAGSIQAMGSIQAAGFKAADGSAGLSDTISFLDADGYDHTVVIKNGLIVSWTKSH